MAIEKVYHNNTWESAKYITNSNGSARSLANGAWTKTIGVNLTPGTWLVIGSLRVEGTAVGTMAYYYVTLGTDQYSHIKARQIAPLNIGEGNYAGAISSMLIKVNANTTINMYALPSKATSTNGEYLEAIKLG